MIVFRYALDDDFNKQIESVKANQETVNRMMKELKDPPEQYKDAYDDLRAFYDSYIELTNLAINPTGSRKDFTSRFNDADTKTINGYERMKSYIEE